MYSVTRVTSFCATTVSILTSSAWEILPASPANGFAKGPGLNVPLPLFLNEQHEYSPMLPALVSKRAFRIFCSYSAGT